MEYEILTFFELTLNRKKIDAFKNRINADDYNYFKGWVRATEEQRQRTRSVLVFITSTPNSKDKHEDRYKEQDKDKKKDNNKNRGSVLLWEEV